MIVLLGKSGSGKTTVREILVNEYGFKKAVTHTTRKIRDDDIPDVTYHFVNADQFMAMKNNGELVDSTIAVYDGNYYGLSKAEMSNNKIVIFEPNGAQALKKEGDAFIVYLDVNDDERIRRLSLRGDSPETIERRVESDKITFESAYDIADVCVSASDFGPEDVARTVADIIYSHIEGNL